MRRKIIAFILALAIIFTSGVPVMADKSNKEKLKDVQNDLKNQKSELNENKKTQKSLEEQIESFDKQIAQLNEKINQSNEKKTKLEANIEKTKKELEKAEQERKAQQELLGERLKVMYMYGDVGYLELLFSSKSFSDLVSRITSIQTLVTYDKKIIAQLQAIEDKIEKKKATLESNKKKLVKVIASLKEKNEEVASIRSEKNSALESVKDDIAEQKRQIAQREREAEELRSKIASAGNSGNYGNSSGILAWPTPGYYTITSNYGYRYHPIGGYYSFHTGMDIGASYGARVVAPANGVVTMASWYGGYGNAVIIDFGTVKGKRMSCLLGHNSSFAVGSGQRVSRGQTVAYAGSTGNSTGPHCHIEVFVNGERVNPSGYLK